MKHILIVDDESLIRYSLSSTFQNSETVVITSEDGRRALKAIGDWAFDFCFLDIQLPDMTGIEVMKTIRQLSPRTKIIMMTASNVDEAVMQTIRDNAYLFLTKPFDLFRVKRFLDAVSEKDENVFQEFTERESRAAAAERRNHRRQAVRKHIMYITAAPGSGGQKQYYTADLLDISESGTCIRTAYHLEPGSMVQFRNSVRASGIVRWSTNDEKTALYVAGVQFIGSDHNEQLQ